MQPRSDPNGVSEQGQSLGILPTWWDGESLYGWCSRLHTLRGGKNQALGSTLFGLGHASRVVDIPSGLGRFVHATGGRLGTAEEIVRTRTVAAAYWPFASDSTRQQLVQAATNASGVTLPMVLGLPGGSVRAHHPLRSCPECRCAAEKANGYATWQLGDQLPGVWWCPEHGRPLEQVTISKGVWRKPGHSGTSLDPPIGADEAHALAMMRALAHAIASASRVSSWAIASAVVDRLSQLGIATSPAKLNAQRLHEWLEAAPHVRWMRRQGTAVLMPTPNWAVPLIRGRSRPNPLKWAMLWTAAWRDESVERAVADFLLSADGDGVQAGGAQFLLWPQGWGGAAEGALPADVADAFLAGGSIPDVATALGTDIPTVRRWLDDRPQFAKAWLKRVRGRRLQRAREHLLSVLADRPDITPSEFIQANASDVEWLSGNAPITLRSLLSRLPASSGPQLQLF
jgi:hypothetical protein